jgi:hypothetical protein
MISPSSMGSPVVTIRKNNGARNVDSNALASQLAALDALDSVPTIRPGASVLFEATLSLPTRWRPPANEVAMKAAYSSRAPLRAHLSRALSEIETQGGCEATAR